MMSKHPQPDAPIFFLFARTLAYHSLLVDTRALASLSCPKRLSGGPNKRQTNPSAIEKLGHQSGRGAIALNSNDKVGFKSDSSAGLTTSPNSDMLSCVHQNSFSNAFFEKDYDVDKRLLLATKSFANDENKNDRRAFRKPLLPSELRNSDYEVEGQRLTSTNEKALF